MYKKLKVIFVQWLQKYLCNYDLNQWFIVGRFLDDVKRAYKLVPQFNHLEEFDEDGDEIFHELTDEDSEVMLKYFHENPDIWQKYLDEY